MTLRLTNTLTGKKEDLIPLKEKKIQMYVCGPTVYGLTHIGNARPVVFFDVVRRYLKFLGYQVKYVSNFTDVDDKIINRAKEENKTAEEIALFYTQEFIKDRELLGTLPPDSAPKVSETIPEIISFIEKLIKKKAAYVASDGEVFFSVRRFKDYGKLSGKKIDELQVGARVAPDEKKEDPLDFSLWKPQKTEGEPAWQSPWGKGRPGWHIECSVMACKNLGESIDIHGGGVDLIHPHHENEIAQSEACTGKPFVKYWLHNNLITMQSQKMSKSLGNIFLTRDFVEHYTAETLRFILLSGHYRSSIEFSEKVIRDSQAALHRFYSCVLKALQMTDVKSKETFQTPEEKNVQELSKNFPLRWKSALDEDFNTALVVGAVFEYVRALNAYWDKKDFKPSHLTATLAKDFLAHLKKLSSILNLFGQNAEGYLNLLREKILVSKNIKISDIEDEIQRRMEARQRKDFKTADEIRDKLLGLGILLKDSPQGTTWDVSFS